MAGLDSVAVKKLKNGEAVFVDNDPLQMILVKKRGGQIVREGDF